MLAKLIERVERYEARLLGKKNECIRHIQIQNIMILLYSNSHQSIKMLCQTVKKVRPLWG